MENEVFKKASQHAFSCFPVWPIFAIVLIPVGITFMCLSWSNQLEVCSKFSTVKVIDYTNCEDLVSETNETCRQVLLKNDVICKCIVKFNLTEDVPGDLVLYYELDTFNQSETAKAENFFLSRDDKQLSGELSTNVSEACGNYSYDKYGLPIAPCGALADSMFTDELAIIPPHKNISFVPQSVTGLIPEEYKTRFHNPPPKDNLTSAFQNFSKPTSWDFDIWQLDTARPENNGFENIIFIGWMTTYWKRKPMWRLNRTRYEEFKNGLPAGEYTLQVEYRYPVNRYDGPRKAVLAKPFSFTDEPKCTTHVSISSGFVIGIIAVILGIIFLVLTTMSIFVDKPKENVVDYDQSSRSLRSAVPD